ncbi:NTP-binding protein [Salmonella enterica subsp. diarizonae]|nr:NTP-binding protein [Salmonella enterica subsp. diarizonae]
MTSDIFLSGVACTPGLTASKMVQSSSENDSTKIIFTVR